MTTSASVIHRTLLGFGAMLTPYRRSKAAATLSQLDDRMLRDIGLTRFDVDAMRRMW